MKTTEDSIKYKKMPEADRHKLQRQFHESELNYFTSFSFESGIISEEDVKDLNNRIDKKVKGNSFGSGMNVFIALICGVFIGASVFFAWFEKSKTHASHYEDLSSSSGNESNSPLKESELLTSSREKVVSNTNTLPGTEIPKEHFSISGSAEELHTYTPMEDAEIKDINSIEVKEQPLASEENFEYIPNAPVIFIYDLKIANYKTYYFKDNRNVDVRDNGLSAQFSNKEESQSSLNKRLEERDYYAHEIIKDAMHYYHKKQYTGCIDLLELLYKFNKADVNAQFYLGMSYFNLGNYNKAAGFFDTVENNTVNVFVQEAEFYKALCYKKSGKGEAANELFKKIISRKLFYADRAKEELIK